LRTVAGAAHPEGERFESVEAFERWLAEHHAQSDGLWLKLARTGSGIPSVTQPEAVETALRFGWIDGQARSLDERFYLQRFTPRRARSMWSKRNRERATALIAEGRMEPGGLAEVERAKADGRWEAAYDAPSGATVPDDLQRALDAEPRAAALFATLDSRNRYSILHRVQTAKKPETRARRIAGFVAMLAEGRTLYP
jgi:uncharacterized protein YdeI (YjbR/CyaY-like superfamily)